MVQSGERDDRQNAAPQDRENCQEQLAELRQQVADMQDKYLRAAAQVENTRRWTERDTLARAAEKERSLLRQLLEVVDNLERALLQSPAEPDPLSQGVRLTLRQLEGVLERAGVQRIQVEPGEPFDPGAHEAIEVRRGQVGEPVVMEVVQAGYTYDGSLLRPARVVVVQ